MQFGSVFPLLIFLSPSSTVLPPFIAVVLRSHSVFLSPFFRVVVSYGALIATLWVTVSIESLVTVPGKTQTPRVCGIALPLFPETGVSSAYISGRVLVPGRAIVSGRVTFASTLRLHHLIEVSRTRAEVVAWPTWCLYVLNTSPPVSGLVSVMREEQKLMVEADQPGASPQVA